MYGMVQMFAGITGMLLGGITADRLTGRGVESSSYKLVILGAAIATPFAFMYSLMGSEQMSLWLMVGTIFGTNICFACAASAMQRMYPAAMLGLAAGIYFFMSNAVGLMVGPTVVAAITDYGFGDPQKVGYSLSIVGGVARLLALVVFVVGLGSYVRLLREREGRLAT
jgi:MFS family permease